MRGTVSSSSYFNPLINEALDTALAAHVPNEAHGHVRQLMGEVLSQSAESTPQQIASTIEKLAGGKSVEQLKAVGYDHVFDVHHQSVPVPSPAAVVKPVSSTMVERAVRSSPIPLLGRNNIVVSVEGLANHDRETLRHFLLEKFPGKLSSGGLVPLADGTKAADWVVSGTSLKKVQAALSELPKAGEFTHYTPVAEYVKVVPAMEAKIQGNLYKTILASAKEKFPAHPDIAKQFSKEMFDHVKGLDKNFTLADIKKAIATYPESGAVSPVAHFEQYLGGSKITTFPAAVEKVITSAPDKKSWFNGVSDKVKGMFRRSKVDPAGVVAASEVLPTAAAAPIPPVAPPTIISEPISSLESFNAAHPSSSVMATPKSLEQFRKWTETPKKSMWQRFNDWRNKPSPNYLAMEAREAGVAEATAAAAEHGGVVWNNIAERGRGVVAGITEHGGSAISGIVEHGGAALKGASRFGGNLVLAGVAGAGLLTLGALLSAPRPRTPSLPTFDDDALAFSGGDKSNVDVGAIAMPALGQQQQAGTWVSKLPSLEEQMAANGLSFER